MQTVLISAPYIIPNLDRFRIVLESYGLNLLIAPVRERLEESELLAYAGQFDGTICGDDRYTSKVLLACAPRLKVISKWGSGIDSIDSRTAEQLGIQVCRTPNAFTLPVSDTVLGYMLAFARCQPWMHQAMKSGNWKKIPGHTLSERTLGVVGVGRIGQAIIRRAKAFGMQVFGNDIIEIDPAFIAENGLQMVSLQELLGRSDYISLNCDLNPTSYHLINERTIQFVKPGAVLINTSRGPVVEEAALIKALESGRLGGAALDVFEIEPLPESSSLTRFDNVLLAPHNANSSPAAWERVHCTTIRNLLLGLAIQADDLQQRIADATGSEQVDVNSERREIG